MNERKKIYVTSDLHLGHRNCLEFDDRPFGNIDHMHRVLVNNFNATVPADGITYFLGDIGMCSFDLAKSIIDQMNGTKILILGNHDGNMNRMYRMGFDAIMNNCSMMIAGELVTMSHCPLTGVFREDTEGMSGAVEGENWHGEEKNKRFSVEDTGQYHLHGHLHLHKDKGKVKDGRQWDIGVVGNNYTPVSISAIESWISKHKRGK